MTDFLVPFFEFLGFFVQAALECAAVVAPSGHARSSEPGAPPRAGVADRTHPLWDRDLDF